MNIVVVNYIEMKLCDIPSESSSSHCDMVICDLLSYAHLCRFKRKPPFNSFFFHSTIESRRWVAVCGSVCVWGERKVDWTKCAELAVARPWSSFSEESERDRESWLGGEGGTSKTNECLDCNFWSGGSTVCVWVGCEERLSGRVALYESMSVEVYGPSCMGSTASYLPWCYILACVLQNPLRVAYWVTISYSLSRHLICLHPLCCVIIAFIMLSVFAIAYTHHISGPVKLNQGNLVS